MSNVPPVNVLSPNEKHIALKGTTTIDRRSRAAEFNDLSAGFIEYAEHRISDPWTLPYEEAFYIISGELTLHHDGCSVSGGPGDMMTIARGTTVRYEGTAGFRAFFCLVPADWMDQI